MREQPRKGVRRLVAQGRVGLLGGSSAESGKKGCEYLFLLGWCLCCFGFGVLGCLGLALELCSVGFLFHGVLLHFWFLLEELAILLESPSACDGSGNHSPSLELVRSQLEHCGVVSEWVVRYSLLGLL